MNFEIDIIKWLQSFSSPFLDVVAKTMSYLFDYPCMLLIGILLFLFYDKKYSVYFVLVSLISAGFQFTLKLIFDRPRPYLVSSQINNVYEAIGSSFPSGHSVTAMGIALFLGYILIKSDSSKTKKVWGIVGLIVYLLFNAINRMYLGQHYLTDIFAGYLLMLSLAALSYILFPMFVKLWNIIFVKKIKKND